MLWISRLELLLVYCHSTLLDKQPSKKSKIIGFNFKKQNPTPQVYLSNYQAPPNRGRVMRASSDQKYIFLADCENPGNFSNCYLRVLGDLDSHAAKTNYVIKINGVLKEFDVLGSDMVVALTNDNKIQIFRID